tara:strand:- start:364 stop:1344 length:981 start_codon:yes stop_codon:yes gene_type:complete
MRITERHLRKIIRGLLIENFSVESRKRLEKIVADLNMILEKSSNKDISYIMKVYNAFLLTNGFKKIGEGISRRAYSSDNDFFVIKIATSNEGATVNKSEVDISRGHHGHDTQKMFLDMYDYDKISKYPYWTICEKVIPLNSIEDINVLNKIFPTFYKITNGVINDPYEFKEFIVDVISEWASSLGVAATLYYDFNKLSKEKGITGKDRSPEQKYFTNIDSRKEKYNAMYPGINYKLFIEKVKYIWDVWLDRPINELIYVKPGEDIVRLANCFKHISTRDLHGGNLAVKYNKNISSKDIVILDLDFGDTQSSPSNESIDFRPMWMER